MAGKKIKRPHASKSREPELREEFVREILERTKAWEKKHEFKRGMTLKELEAL